MSDIVKAHSEIFKEMRTTKDKKTVNVNVIQRVPSKGKVTFADPVATVNFNQHVPSEIIPSVHNNNSSHTSTPKPSPTPDNSPVEFDAGEEDSLRPLCRCDPYGYHPR